MVQRIKQCLLMTVGVAMLATTAYAADSSTVTATGVAAVYGKDKAAAFDKAIEDAKRKAVEQAVGSMVSSETVTANFQLISDTIYSRASGFVQKYSVKSKKFADGVYEVTIVATVSNAMVEDALGALYKQMDMPRVLVMISEQNVGSAAQVSWWAGESSYSIDLGSAENAIIDLLNGKGFDLVDRQTLKGKVKARKGLSDGTPQDGAVKDFAVQTGAEVVIVGSAIATDVGTIMGTAMHSIRGNISVRALNLDNGKILATSTQTHTVGHIDPATGGTQALDKVSRKATKDLIKKILDKWSKSVNTATVNLTISGVKKSKYLRVIKTYLGNELRGVQNVRQRRYSRKVAEFDIDIKGDSTGLAEELEEKPWGEFAIEIEEITPNKVTATLVAK